jgi:hypothetical protein
MDGLSVLERIRPIGFDPDEGISMLLYGKSGTGKTTLWATFPGPILAIVISGGARPGELRSVDTAEYREKIKTVTIKESSEVGLLIEHLRENPGLFATAVIDHVTGLQDMTLKEILGIDELPAQKGWGMASQQQYGQCTQQTKEILRAFLSLGLNRVIVAQERNFNEDSDSELRLAPTVGAALTPSLTGWLNPSCDYVVQTFLRAREEVKDVVIQAAGKAMTKQVRKKTNEAEFCLRVAPHAVYQTKFRVPKGIEFPEGGVIVDADYTKLMALIRGEV